jgi:hypothetical protein
MLSLHRLSFFTNFLDDQSNINQQKLKNSPMKTDQLNHPAAVFLQTVSAAIAQLKQQLQRNYEQDYPGLREIVHLVLDEEETKAWELSLFPHLLLPDLVEAHIEKLNLRPADTRHEDLLMPQPFPEIDNHQPAFALCG